MTSSHKFIRIYCQYTAFPNYCEYNVNIKPFWVDKNVRYCTYVKILLTYVVHFTYPCVSMVHMYFSFFASWFLCRSTLNTPGWKWQRPFPLGATIVRSHYFCSACCVLVYALPHLSACLLSWGCLWRGSPRDVLRDEFLLLASQQSPIHLPGCPMSSQTQDCWGCLWRGAPRCIDGQVSA